METKKSAGALKSWTCVAVLTFFVPAAGFELSTMFFSVSATTARAISQYFEAAEPNEHPLVVSCRGDISEEII